MYRSKFILENIFYIFGTFILLIISFFVGTNFITDSRVFQTEGKVVERDSSVEKSKEVKIANSGIENEKTEKFEYVRSQKVEKEMSDSYLADEKNDVKSKSNDIESLPEKKSDVKSNSVKKDDKSSITSSSDSLNSTKDPKTEIDSNNSSNDNKNGSSQYLESSERKYKVELINYSNNPELESFISENLELRGYIVSVSKTTSIRKVDTVIIERNDLGVGNLLQSHLNIGNVIQRFDSMSKFDATIILGSDYNN